MAFIEFNTGKKKKKQKKQIQKKTSVGTPFEQGNTTPEKTTPQKKMPVSADNTSNVDYLSGEIFPLGENDIMKPYGFWSTYCFKLWNIPARRRYARWKKQPHRRIGVNMELANGHCVIFGVTEEKEGFIFQNQKYLFDNKLKYWVVGLNMFFYDFHEKISIPIKREIPIDTIKTTIENMNNIELAYALNPSTLERFERARIAEGIMKGQVIDGMLRLIAFLIIAVGFIAIMILFIVAWKLKVFNIG